MLPMQNKKAASWTKTRREYVTKPPCRNAQGSEPYCERSKSEDSNVASGGNFALFIPGLGPNGAQDSLAFAEHRGNVYQVHGCCIQCGAQLPTSLSASLEKTERMDAKAKGSPQLIFLLATEGEKLS